MIDALPPIAIKDFLLGFFIALALRRDRIRALLDTKLPPADEASLND